MIRRLLLLAVFLPAVALAQPPELVVATEQLRLEFTPDGDLARARACLPDCRSDRHVRDFGESSALLRLDGEIPNPLSAPPGCRFHPRCGDITSACQLQKPGNIHLDSGINVACLKYSSHMKGSP